MPISSRLAQVKLGGSLNILTDPLVNNNPIILQILGICSALAVTTALIPSLYMASGISVRTGHLLHRGHSNPAVCAHEHPDYRLDDDCRLAGHYCQIHQVHRTGVV